MSRLDRSRPFGENWGGNGLESYVQDGRLFRTNGDPYDGATEDNPPPPETATEAAADVVKRAVDGRSKEARAAKRAAEAAPAADSELSDLDDDELKALVEINGFVWTDRKAALAMLGEK